MKIQNTQPELEENKKEIEQAKKPRQLSPEEVLQKDHPETTEQKAE